MKAGRELDLLIAEKIFGLSRQRIEDLEGDFADGPLLARYSSDIAAAWKVVEKIYDLEKVKADQNGVGVGNIGFDLFHDLLGCEAIFRNWCDYKTSANGDTAPHAICLAALKAVGVEV